MGLYERQFEPNRAKTPQVGPFFVHDTFYDTSFRYIAVDAYPIRILVVLNADGLFTRFSHLRHAFGDNVVMFHD
jgi:hypothetical protein